MKWSAHTHVVDILIQSITSHCFSANLIVAVIVCAMKPVEELGGLDITEAAFVVKEVAELTKISLD
jgi:hypothetical protein